LNLQNLASKQQDLGLKRLSTAITSAAAEACGSPGISSAPNRAHRHSTKVDGAHRLLRQPLQKRVRS